jgi:glutamate synthase (NADPH/NADH) small chain
MGKPTGLLEFQRILEPAEAAAERTRHHREFVTRLTASQTEQEGARCMDCGVPFCQSGCPVENVVPDWNDLVYRGDWRRAAERLHATNNFPEFTGRVCPAPCEAACTLNLEDTPVGIRSIECALVDRAFEEGWVTPRPAAVATGRRVAVVGSGPAGLAAAQQLARVGHAVTVYEKADRPGGLLRYGIPDFKLEKVLVDRRLEQLRAEGVRFEVGVEIGRDLSPAALLEAYDAVILACGAETPRDLPVPGRDLEGVHLAMDFLTQQNRLNAGYTVPGAISAAGRHVVVIGGGDTGSDCVGTSHRQGAASVTQLERLPRPPEREDKGVTWPYWPLRLRTSSSLEEGGERDWAIETLAFLGEAGQVTGLEYRRLDAEGAPETLPADLVLLAVGFAGPDRGLLERFVVATDAHGRASATTDPSRGYRTTVPRLYAAGDVRRGQSLVVWAIREGRQCAHAVDADLMGSTSLPR